MSHRSITLLVTVSTEHVSGKFAPRDEIVDALVSMLEGADEGTIYGVGADSNSEYEIVEWEVQES